MTNIRAAAPQIMSMANAGQVAFIDTGVLGWETLRDALPQGIEAVLVAPDADGVAVLAASLAGRRGVDAIHVLSHGFAGGFTLGAARVDRASLAERAEAWSAIGESLAADGDILLYSCSVASGAGDAFLDDLAEITGANLAASRTLTGAAELGGDWKLGWVRGAVTTPSLHLAGFAGVLAAPELLSTSVGEGTKEIFLKFDQDLDSDNPPHMNDISAGGMLGRISVNGAYVTFASLRVEGDTLIITHVDPFVTGDVVELNYTDPDVGDDSIALQGTTGEDVASFYATATVAVPSAPSLTATGENATFAQGAGTGVDLFDTVVVAANDPGQVITGVTFTITNVSDSSELVSWDATGIPLTHGASGPFGQLGAGGGSFTVSVTGTTATLTASGLSYSAADFANLVDLMEYYNSDATATAGQRVITITGITDNGTADNTATLSGVTATVDVAAPPAFVSANGYVDENFVTLLFNGPLDPTNLPSVSDFALARNGGGVSAAAVEVDASGMGLKVTLSSALTLGDIIEFTYNDPTGGDDASAIQSPTGLDAVGFNDSTVVLGARPVTFESAEINGQFLTLTYDGPLASLPTASVLNFVVLVEGVTVTVNSLLVDGPAGTVTLVLDEAVAPGHLVEFTYNDPTGGNDVYAIQAPNGNDTDSIGLTAVSNVTVAPVGDTPPVATGNAAISVAIDDSLFFASVFENVTVDTIDAMQTITGMVFTVHNVSTATEYLKVSGVSLALLDGEFGSSGVGYDYVVSVVDGVATVTLSNLTESPSSAALLIEGVEYGKLSSSLADPGGAAVRPVVLRSITDSGADGANTTDVNLVGTVTITDPGGGALNYFLSSAPVDPTLTFTAGTPTEVEFLITVDANLNLIGNTINFVPELPSGWSYGSVTLAYVNQSDLTESPILDLSGLIVNGAIYKVTFDVVSSGTDNVGVFPVSLSAISTGPSMVSALKSSSVMMAVEPPDVAPTLTATGGTPEFEGGSTTAVSLFTAAVADAEDVGQTFTSLTLTVTGVVDGTETLVIGGVEVALTNSIVGIAGHGPGGLSATAVVVVNGTTATVFVSGLERDNAQMGTLIESLGYKNTDANATIGDRVITVTQVTDDGIVNTGTITGLSATVTVTDVTPPATPVVTSSNVTNDATPVISGTAEDGATVVLTIGGAIYNVVATGGTWSVDLGTAPTTGTLTLLEGSTPYTVSAIDASNNTSTTSAMETLVLDLTAPDAPVITSDALTNNPAPVISGTAEAGSTVAVMVGGAAYTTVAAGGVWSIDLATATPDAGVLSLNPNGSNAVLATATDAAGNTTVTPGSSDFTIDTTLPASPTFTSTAMTNDTTPVISGNAEMGATVTITVGGATYTTVATLGAWTIDTNTATPTSGTLLLDTNGDNTVTATATDLAGNVSAVAGVQTLTIDTTAPATPVITSAALTNVAAPVISGTAEADATVTVLVGAATYITVATGGVWSIDLATATPDSSGSSLMLDTNGNNYVAARATDAVGNISLLPAAQVLVIDTTAPDAPVITSDALTDSITPVISGTAEADATVTVTVNGAVYSAVAAGGAWSIDLATATPVSGSLVLDPNGGNAVSAIATDAVGNVSATPSTQILTIDTTPPATPVITSGALTNSATPVISGTAEEGATVTMVVGTAAYMTVATGGVWSIDLATATPTGTLALDTNGSNSIIVHAIDVAGNQSTLGFESLTIDTTLPDTPVITSGALTNSTTPVISGTAEAGATVTVTVGGATYSAVATGGAWSIDLATAAPVFGSLVLDANGSNAVSVFATDAAGNASATPAIQALAIDTTLPDAPVITSDAITNVTTPVVTGTAEAGATVTVNVSGAIYSAVATDGTWSIDLATATPISGSLALNANGSNVVTAVAVDAAGNQSATGGIQLLAIDTLLPGTPIITSPALANGVAPVISGTAEAGVTITLSVGGATYTTEATGGAWSIDLDSATPVWGTPVLDPNGSNAVSVIATDAAGNVSAVPATQALIVDTTRPATPVITSEALTNFLAPVITGTAEDGATVTVSVGGATYTTVATGGAWSIDLDLATPTSGILALDLNGDNVVVAGARDPAGNNSATPAIQTLVIDSTVPETPVFTSDAVTNSATPVIGGTAEAGATVTVNVGGAVYETVATDGAWSIDLATATPLSGSLLLDTNGINPVSAIATDAAGNVSTLLGFQMLTIDTTVPATPAITSGALTNSVTPVIDGTAEAGATVTVTVTGATYEAVATGGVWSIDLATATPVSGSLMLDPNGANAVAVVATDAAGNASLVPAIQTLIIDTTLPAMPVITSDAITNDTTPVVSGTAEADTTVTVTIGGATYLTVATGGVWSIDLSTATPDSGTLVLNTNGINAMTAFSADASGNNSLAALQMLMIDTTVPDEPIISSAAATNSAAPTIAGSAEDGSTVTVLVGGATYAVLVTGGAWSVDLATATPIEGSLALDLNGENAVSVTTTDAAGNESTAASQQLIIDTTAPDVATITGLAVGSDSGVAGDSITTVTTPTVTGFAEAGALVVLFDTDGTTVLGETTADGGGAWSITSSALALGSHDLQVQVTDPLGNASGLSGVLVVDIVESDLPPIYVSSPEYPSEVVAKIYEGPVDHLVYEFMGSSSGEAVVATDNNDFLNLLGGDDAADGGAGDDVLDGGTGSNFLTGGAGADVFFLDGRGGETTWSTITDWEGGEQLAVWGWRMGESTAIWVDDAGAEGYRGVTMHADLDADNVIDTSVTWAGLTRADLPTPTEHEGLLWFA